MRCVTWLTGLAPAVALALAACHGSAAPVSSTTTAHRAGPKAPPSGAPAAEDRTGEAPLPKVTDPDERVVFTRAGSVFLFDPRPGEGGGPVEPTRVTQRAAAAPDESPALSPHGEAVAFSAARDGAAKIWLVGVDGQNLRALTDGKDGGDRMPAWAPDGRKLVFVRGRHGERRDLYVVDFDGSAAPRLLVAGKDAASAHVGAPAWSPDGAVIVFAADRQEGEGTGLWLVAPDGTGLRRLTRPGRAAPWVRDLAPSWTPDSKRIVFASNREAAREDDAGDFDLYSADLATGAITRLTRDPGSASEPSVSPDGQRIYFTSTRELSRDYEIELYAMPAGGGQQVRLTRDEHPQNAAPSAGRIR